MKTNIAAKIQNLINHALGIDAIKMRLETAETLVTVLRGQVKDLNDQLGDFDPDDCVVQRDIEDFITERQLDEAIEDSMNNQDWDSIVSGALSERHCSSVLEDVISEADFTEARGFQVAVATALTTELEEDTDGNLASTIKNAINSIPVKI